MATALRRASSSFFIELGKKKGMSRIIQKHLETQYFSFPVDNSICRFKIFKHVIGIIF